MAGLGVNGMVIAMRVAWMTVGRWRRRLSSSARFRLRTGWQKAHRLDPRR